ncbi:MAG: hypothetical protein HYW45_03710 [Candidatus Daviesbacteria bacterium]|nr:MAG: hypothetical protein HYW45_03710 [Candidatus Daviesbacteria bacterium]
MNNNTENPVPAQNVGINPSETLTPPEISERNKVLKALQIAIEIARQNQDSPEDRWILKSVLDAEAKSLDIGKDTYTNHFFNDEIPDPNTPSGFKEFDQEEGIPVEGLLKKLNQELSILPPNNPQAVEIEEAIDTLTTHSKKYEEAHGEAIKNNPQESDLLRGRKKQEAYWISRPQEEDWRPSGDTTANWYSGEDYLENRLELQIPEENEPPPPPPPPPPPELPREVEFGIAAGKTRIEHQTEIGQNRGNLERIEELSREQGRRQMTEDRQRWESRLSFVRQFLPRFWKYTVGEVATYNKEKNHAARLLAESGLQMTALPYEFLNQVDEAARQNIRQRRTGLGRLTGGIQDAFRELTFQEKDLHNERVAVVRNLRGSLDNPADPNLQQFIQQNPNLLLAYRNIATGDFQAAEALATKISSNWGGEIVQEVVNSRAGERVSTEPIELTGEIKTYLVDSVIRPILTEGLQNNGTINPNTLHQVRRSVQEMFFRPEFIRWYDQQPQQVRDSLQLSLSYGSDIARFTQEVLLPQLLQAREHLQVDNNLQDYINNLSLKVNVGTLEAGTKGVVEEGLVERAASRTITNQEVFHVYQDLRNRNQAPVLIPDTYLNAAVTRADLLGGLTRAATNQIIMGVGIGVGIYVAQRLATGAAGVALPVIGGSVVAGVLRGAQERRLFTREREQHGVEEELGYQFPTDARRREQQRAIALHKKEMPAELTAPMQQILTEVQNRSATNDRLIQLMGLVADTQARVRLMDQIGYGLLSATDNTPEVYQQQKTELELTRASAQVALRSFLGQNQNRLMEIQNALLPNGNAPQNADRTDWLITQLTENQMDHLRNATAINANFQIALGNLGVNEAESIARRQQAFDAALRYRIVSRGLMTTAAGIGGYALTNLTANAVGNLLNPGGVSAGESLSPTEQNPPSTPQTSPSPGFMENLQETKPILGPEGEWIKHSTNVDHREWYSYDRPGSQQNELRFYTHKEGESIILDMRNMGDGFQKGLNPNPVKVPEIIQNKEAGWYFSLPSLPQDGVWVSDGADGNYDGILRLDPNANPSLKVDPNNPNSMSLAEFSKIVLNQQALQNLPDGNIATEVYNRQDIFNLGQDGKYGFIEAGRMVQRDGVNVLQNFATIRGLGALPEAVEVKIPDLVPPEEPPSPIEPTPAGPGTPETPLGREPFYTDWGVPFFIARRPLEQPERRGAPPIPAGPRPTPTPTPTPIPALVPTSVAPAAPPSPLTETLEATVPTTPRPPIRVSAPEPITQAELDETREWVEKQNVGNWALTVARGGGYEERVLRRIAEHAREEQRIANELYLYTFPLDEVGQRGIDWELQTNPDMLTCQFASAGNILRALDVYDSNKHKEENFVNYLGGKEYSSTHRGGAIPSDVERALEHLAPEVATRRSNSVSQILGAVENGAGVIVPLGPGHVGAIMPGNRVTRGPDGNLQVQILDPIQGPILVPMVDLIRSDITVPATSSESSAIIIEKAISLISPDEIRLEPAHQPTPTPVPERPHPPAGDLLAQINHEISTSTTGTIHYETTPDNLNTYLKTLQIPNTKINQLNSRIQNGQLIIEGDIARTEKVGPFTVTGTANFTARLETDPSGNIQVIIDRLDLNAAAGTRRGEVEKQIRDINRLLKAQINSQIDHNWQVSGFEIKDGKLGINFKEVPFVSPPPPRRRV